MYKFNRHLISCLLMVTIAYLPMVTFVMSIKNDALSVSYPVFYFFSNELHNGNLPWWHFNMNMGFPLHADPGTPFWNPLWWMFALVGKNIYIYTLFIYLHILIAATGMFKLSKWLKLSDNVSTVLGVVYVCSGFYVSHLQHPNNLLEAAYLPFILMFFLQMLLSPTIRSAILLSISIFFFVNSGYPAFPMSLVYFLLPIAAIVIIRDKNLRTTQHLKSLIRFFSFSFVIAIGLSLPYLVSIFENLDSFNRFVPLDTFRKSIENGGMTSTSVLSVLFPVASITNITLFPTSITWNNIYIGTIAFAFFIYSLFYVKHYLKLPLLIAGILMLLLSHQGILKEYLFFRLPLFNMIRSNGELRIYFVLVSALISGFALELLSGSIVRIKLKRILIILGMLYIVSIIISGIFINADEFNMSYQFFKEPPVWFTILVQSVFGLIILGLALKFIHNKRRLSIVIVADIILMFWIGLPYTGLGLSNTASAQKAIDETIAQVKAFPESYSLREISDTSDLPKFISTKVLFSPFPGYYRLSTYPSSFRQYMHFSYYGYLDQIKSRPCIFSIKEKSIATHLNFTGNKIIFNWQSSQNDTIVIAQNFQKNWTAFIDDKEAEIGKYRNTLMSLETSPGNHSIVLKYSPQKVLYAFYAWLVIVIAIITYLIYYKQKAPK